MLFRSALGAVALLVAFAVLTWRMGIFAESLRMQGRTTVILTLPQAPFIWTTTVLLGASTFVQAIAAWDHVRAASAARRAPWTRLDRIVWPCVALFALACVYVALNWTRVSYLAQDYPATTVIIGFLLMWILLLALIPLAAVLALSGLAGAGLLIGWGPAMSAYATEAAGFLTNYQVATLPLFLMMGSFAAVAGVSDDVYRLAQAALGRFRGGLAMATIGGCAGFGAVTGSSLATVATFGRVSLPQMEARKYAPHFAAGCVAAGGTLGALIPPSGPLVIFALLTEASIGQLFVAAIVPGLIATAFYIATIAIIVRRDPDAALAVWRGDQAIDAANKALMRDILSAMTEDPRNIPFGAQLLFCVKNLERMGDHVTNIAETIYYIVKGVVLDEARPKG